MAVTKIKPIKSTLKKALDYIQNPDKTDGKMLVSSFGCSAETADIEFGFTLSQALDRGNNLAHHLIQSFEPGEVDYQKAHEIGRQLADAVTKGQYEYVLTTHIDKGHIHNHIIFCAVNFVDYHKYNSNKRSYYGIFCVILSRGLYCFMVLHLQSAPSQGRNILHLIQSRYNGGQGFLLQILWFRFRKTGL